MIPYSATVNVALSFLLVWAYPILCEDQQREVAIIKQINRVNEDGTYTFGYEAADGSFKIETRDVMGNVKGMFGFVDDQGELKRVSYTASNGTGFQATTGSVSNQGGVTRKPVLIFRHPPGVIPTPVTRSPVIQHIPRRTTTARPDYSSSPEPQASSTEGPRPVRILVTKRPIGDDERTGHDLRRQLTPIDQSSLANHLKQLALNSQQTVRDQLRRQQLLGADHLRQAAETKRQVDSNEEDSPDVYSGGIAGGHRLYPHRALRIQQVPIGQAPDPREVYRNMLLEQSGLKPDLPPRRYYSRPSQDDEDYDDAPIPAMVPVANRVLPVMLRGRIDDGYSGDNYLSRPGYSRLARQRYNGYGGLDYEALRDELMQYLLQYLEYRLGRANPNQYYGRQVGYQQNFAYQQPNYNYYQDRYYPRQPPYQRGYNNGYNQYQGYPAPIPSPYPGTIPVPQAVQLTANNQYPGISPNVQYTGNVQYSNGQDSPGTVNIPADTAKQENRIKVSTLKQRMAEIGDANDNHHTQPMPSASLIQMLLATPSPRRPLIPQRLIQTQTPLPLQNPVQRNIQSIPSSNRNIQTIPNSRPVTTTHRQPVRSVEILTAATTASSPVVTSTTPAPVTEPSKDEMQAVS